MKDRSDNPSHYERTLLPQSYISLPRGSKMQYLEERSCEKGARCSLVVYKHNCNDLMHNEKGARCSPVVYKYNCNDLMRNLWLNNSENEMYLYTV